MQICDTTVTEEHIGSWVTYVPHYAHGDAGHMDCLRGTIKSFNDTYIFVSYVDGSTAATKPQDLMWG
jgi:hypothetical protein